MRLIDADALEKAIYKWMPEDQETWMESNIPPIENLIVSIMMTIQEQPTVDAREVQHGKWVNDNHRIKCSICGGPIPIRRVVQGDETVWEDNSPVNYCPNCGARMDE